MEIKFRQKGIGWCAVYTWANLLNEPGVLRLCDDERFKGISDKEEAELMATFRPDCRIKEIAYINPAYGYVPNSLIWNIVTRPDDLHHFDEQVAIHILSIRLIESMHHYVATVTYDKKVYYLDPLRDEWLQIYDPEGFDSLFIDCCCVSRPVHIETDSFASFDALYFQYPFLQSQQQTA